MSDDSTDESEAGRSPRDRIEEEADRAVEEFDARVVDILSWVLETETRARIYVYLRQHPWSTSEEVAEGTGLYPSTVREALAGLTEEETLKRQKRQSEGAGNNPYEYTAIAPSELVGGVVGRVQDELNTVFNLDRHLDENPEEAGSEPVRIEVESESGAADAGADDVGVEKKETGSEADGNDAETGPDADTDAESTEE